MSGRIRKDIDDDGAEYLARLFERITKGESKIPREWTEGRITLIEKPNSIPGNLLTYRPITVSPITYRLFARVIIAKIQKWVEKNNILGEMQHGYREGMRGDDCRFIITSAIEMARAQRRGLIATFLDCTKAYDKVCRAKLWSVLAKLGLHTDTIKLLKLLYQDNN